MKLKLTIILNLCLLTLTAFGEAKLKALIIDGTKGSNRIFQFHSEPHFAYIVQ